MTDTPTTSPTIAIELRKQTKLLQAIRRDVMTIGFAFMVWMLCKVVLWLPIMDTLRWPTMTHSATPTSLNTDPTIATHTRP